jgi:ParB/RepB/Spo0J family partition protein
MATAATEVQTKFQMIDLGKISESPMNPRKHFDPQSLKELAESIKAHGVQQPIVVRPDGNKQDRFEIVVGARRSRAAKLAGVKEIPAVIRELSNAAALEIMVIENLQREDVHPLDEALGYEALMKKASETDPELGELPGAPRHTAESIAAKVGKSVGYVYARLKLLALVPAAREAFEQDRITPGHAVLIARLTPADQIRGLHACFHTYFDEREVKKLDPLTVKFADIEEDPLAALIPEKGLREWIQENINLRLKDVPWDLDDEKLVPEAGACATCLKRSTSNPALFAELAVKNEDTCFDAACYQKKRSEFVKIQLHTDKVKARIAEKEGTEAAEKLLQLSDMNAYTKPKPDQAVYRAGQWISAKPGSCADVKPGILVRGADAGQRKNVCINPSCKVHKHNLHGERSSNGHAEAGSYEEQSFQNHRREILLQKKSRARGILIREIVKQVGAKLSTELLRYMADEMHRGDEEVISWLIREKKPLSHEQLSAAIQKADGVKLNKLITALALLEFLGGYNDQDKTDREHLTVFAKSFGIKNAAAVLASADKEIAAAKSCRACGCTEEIPCSWYDNGRKHCSWKEANLCSNPKCLDHEKRMAAKKAKAGK